MPFSLMVTLMLVFGALPTLTAVSWAVEAPGTSQASVVGHAPVAPGPYGALSWGTDINAEATMPSEASAGVKEVAVGQVHSLVLSDDGHVVHWSYPPRLPKPVPEDAKTGVKAVSAGYVLSLALRSDGRVVSWGNTAFGLDEVPVEAQSGVKAISAGQQFALALTESGRVVAWGSNSLGESTPPSSAQSGVVAVAAGYYHALALTDEGRVIAWGNNYSGECDVPPEAQSGIVAVAAGYMHSMALTQDGRVIAWGSDNGGLTTVPQEAQSGIAAIAAGASHSMALTQEGRVIAWGWNADGRSSVPSSAQSGVAAIGASHHSMALRSLGPTAEPGDRSVVLAWRPPLSEGSSPVVGYRIQRRVVGGEWTTAVEDTGSAASGFTVTGLSGGTEYEFRVAAVNAAGVGAWSPPSEPAVPFVSDIDPPVVVGSLEPEPNQAGWFSGPVTVSWAAVDDVDGPVPSPAPTVLDEEGSGQTAISGQVCDQAGNCAVGTVEGISIDLTDPVIEQPRLAQATVPVGLGTALTAHVTDSLSGVGSAEWFVGEDPGPGNAHSAQVTDGSLIAQVPAMDTPGVFPVGVRAVDRAGNWSATATIYLVVYDPSAGFATGGGWLTPGGTTSDAGDALPGLDGTSRADFGFVVRYSNGASSVPSGNLHFRYRVGNFALTSAALDWLVVTNSNWAQFRGVGHVDGMDELVPFRVDARDGARPHLPDRFVLRIWSPDSDPDISEPLYKASGDVEGGQVAIHSR